MTKKTKACNHLICRLLVCFNIELSGGKGIQLEPIQRLLPENEDLLLVVKDLLDAIEAMEKSADESYH